MRKVYYLLMMILLPVLSYSQGSLLELGVGGSVCSAPSPIYWQETKAAIVPDVQLGYYYKAGKHLKLGVSIGVTSYRRQQTIAGNGMATAAYKNSYRIAALAMPIEARLRHSILFPKSQLFVGLSAGAVVCTGSKGASAGPSNDKNTYYYENTMAITGGGELGWVMSTSRRFNTGLGLDMNYVSMNINPAGYGNEGPAVGFWNLQLCLKMQYKMRPHKKEKKS